MLVSRKNNLSKELVGIWRRHKMKVPSPFCADIAFNTRFGDPVSLESTPVLPFPPRFDAIIKTARRWKIIRCRVMYIFHNSPVSRAATLHPLMCLHFCHSLTALIIFNRPSRSRCPCSSGCMPYFARLSQLLNYLHLTVYHRFIGILT